MEQVSYRTAPRRWYDLTIADHVQDSCAMPVDSADTRPAETRKLAAMTFTDMVGFCRQMSAVSPMDDLSSHEIGLEEVSHSLIGSRVRPLPLSVVICLHGGAMATLVLTEDEALELLAFLVTAARTQVDEAPEYAPLRLLTAAQRLGEAILARVSPATRQVLAASLSQLVPLDTPSADPDGYRAKLDGLCAALARHLVAHFGRVEGGDDI